jgi:hypothetical protein
VGESACRKPNNIRYNVSLQDLSVHTVAALLLFRRCLFRLSPEHERINVLIFPALCRALRSNNAIQEVE